MTAFIFPGQGSQSLEMAKDFHDNFTISKNIFEEIEDYTEINIRRIIFDNFDNLINITSFTQICIFASSIAIFKALEEENIINVSQDDIMLGHSLGEYTALACSNKFSLKDCSIVLKERGNLMNNAVKVNTSGMAALIGLNANEIENIIQNNGIDLEIANDNSQIQVVVSGKKDELKKSEIIFKNNGVKKFVLLNVSAAFHSKLMKNAEIKLIEEIEKIDIYQNSIGIISNYSSNLSNNNIEILNSLKKQMSNRVNWTKSIILLEKIGQKKIIEVGPGKVLSGLVKRISTNFDIKSYTKVSDLREN